MNQRELEEVLDEKNKTIAELNKLVEEGYALVSNMTDDMENMSNKLIKLAEVIEEYGSLELTAKAVAIFEDDISQKN